MNRKQLLALSAALAMGIPTAAFADEPAATRESVIQTLWKQEGAPVINYALPYTDISDDDALRWATEAKIVSGYDNGKFEPNRKITREQLAAILYRYAAYKGFDVSVGENTNILSFADALDITPYAIPAIQWAYGSGVFSGAEEYILPSATIAEAEITTALNRMLAPKNAVLIAKIPEKEISLFAEGTHTFLLKSGAKQAWLEWNCTENDRPTLTLADLNHDGKEEICIVYHVDAAVEGIAVYAADTLEELFVPDAREIAESLIAEQDGTYLLSAADGVHSFADALHFSSNVQYTLAENELTATLALETAQTPCGILRLTYQGAEGGFILKQTAYLN